MTGDKIQLLIENDRREHIDNGITEVRNSRIQVQMEAEGDLKEDTGRESDRGEGLETGEDIERDTGVLGRIDSV